MEGRLGVFQHEEIAGPEGHGTGADLGADRAAPSRDHDALASDEGVEPRPVDLHRRAEQQVLDLQGRDLGVAQTLAEAREAGERQPEAASPGDQGVGLGVRLEGARGGEKTPDGHAALREIADHLLEVGEQAEHRHAPDGLGLVRLAVGQDADRLERRTVPASMARSTISTSEPRPRRRVGAVPSRSTLRRERADWR